MPVVRTRALAAAVAVQLAAGPSLAAAPGPATEPAPVVPSPATPDSAPVVPDPPTSVAAPAPSTVAAPAPSAGAVVLLPPRFDAGADDRLREQVDLQLRLGLLRGRLVVADPAAAPPEPCDQRCLAAIGAAARAEFLVRADVTAADRDYTLRLELYGAGGERLAESATTCEVCGLREFATMVADQAALLAGRAVGFARPPPALVVVTDPPGALVLLDGTQLGAAPVERVTTAGTHHVRVQLAGHLPEDRDVELVPGVRETLRLDLRRAPRTLRLRAVGWAALGLAVPLLAAGPALLAVDGRPYPVDCDPQDFNSMRGVCRNLFTTTPAGAAMIAVGAALAITGVALLVHTRDRTRGSQRRPRAAFYGLSGRF